MDISISAVTLFGEKRFEQKAAAFFDIFYTIEHHWDKTSTWANISNNYQLDCLI